MSRSTHLLAFVALLLAACSVPLPPSRPTGGAPPPPPAPTPAAPAATPTPSPRPPNPELTSAAPIAPAPPAAPPKVPAKESAPQPKPAPKPPAPPPVAAAKPPPPPPTPPQVTAPAAAPLDLKSLEQRLRDTKAIGTLTKLSLKNQVDDLIDRFRDFHAGNHPPTLADLRPAFDLLLMKVLSLLQDNDPALARDINASRDTIWGVLADRQKLTQFIQG